MPRHAQFTRILRLAAAPLLGGALLFGSGGAAPAAAASDPALAKKVAAVMKDSRVQRASSGAAVVDLSDGSLLYGRNADRALTPASNTKILTAVTALHTLGQGYRFKTEVLRRARMDGTTVRGQLYLKGYGDPTTMQSDYASLARQVRNAGIRTVTGNLVVDATFFDSNRYNANWSKSFAQDYYAAEISALTVSPDADYDSGTVVVKVTPASKGKRARISTVPAAAVTYIHFVNKTTTGSRGTSLTYWASRSYGSNTITVGGRVPIGRSGSRLITVNRPDLYAGAVFRAELTKQGVTVEGGTIGRPVPAANHHIVAVDRSMTLAQLLVPFLKLSNNMHAETLTKTMGTLKGRPGNWTDGLSYTKAYLTSLGVNMKGIVLVDGSGLTRRNKLTARAFTTVLYKVQSEGWWRVFNAALPVAGNPARMVGGTMRHRLNGTVAAYNAHAKTGTLTGVTALSGYVAGADGRRYAFSMISNYSGSTPRPVEDKFVLTLAKYRR